MVWEILPIAASSLERRDGLQGREDSPGGTECKKTERHCRLLGAQLDHRCAASAFVLGRLGDAGHMRMTLAGIRAAPCAGCPCRCHARCAPAPRRRGTRDRRTSPPRWWLRRRFWPMTLISVGTLSSSRVSDTPIPRDRAAATGLAPALTTTLATSSRGTFIFIAPTDDFERIVVEMAKHLGIAAQRAQSHRVADRDALHHVRAARCGRPYRSR